MAYSCTQAEINRMMAQMEREKRENPTAFKRKVFEYNYRYNFDWNGKPWLFRLLTWMMWRFSDRPWFDGFASWSWFKKKNKTENSFNPKAVSPESYK